MIIKKKLFNTMAVCATLGRLGQKKLYIKKQPQIAAIKSDASKMIRTVLGFIWHRGTVPIVTSKTARKLRHDLGIFLSLDTI